MAQAPEGRETSIELEQVFWEKLETMADKLGHSLEALINQIDDVRGECSLASAIRIYIMGGLPLHTLH